MKLAKKKKQPKFKPIEQVLWNIFPLFWSYTAFVAIAPRNKFSRKKKVKRLHFRNVCLQLCAKTSTLYSQVIYEFQILFFCLWFKVNRIFLRSSVLCLIQYLDLQQVRDRTSISWTEPEIILTSNYLRINRFIRAVAICHVLSISYPQVYCLLKY